MKNKMGTLLVIVLSVLSVSAYSFAATNDWTRIGGDLNVLGRWSVPSPAPGETDNPHMVILHGNPYAVFEELYYVDYYTPGQINSLLYLRTWNGSSWETIGSCINNFTDPPKYAEDAENPRLAAHGDEIFVTWTQEASGKLGQLYVKKWNAKDWASNPNTDWVPLGDVLNVDPNYVARNPVIAIADDGTPYVAWAEKNGSGIDQIYVRKYVAGAWQFVPSTVTSLNYDVNFPVEGSFDLKILGNTPYVTWSEGEEKQDDGIFVKIPSDYSSLEYSTCMGSKNYEKSTGIALAPGGSTWVVGQTNSEEYPVGHNSIGGNDIYLIHQDTNGNSISEYRFGGSKNEGAGSDDPVVLATDSANKVWVVGTTSSDLPMPPYYEGAQFPTTDGSSFIGNSQYGFLTLIDDSSGTASIAFSTVFGGSGVEKIYDACINGNDIYIVGSTTSSDIDALSTNGSTYQGSEDGFVAKFSWDEIGGTLTLEDFGFVGGNGNDVIRGIAIDGTNIYVCGHTNTNGLATPGAIDETRGAAYNAFVARLDGDIDIDYFTYFGGDGAIYASCIAVGATGEVYIGGFTHAGMPVVNIYGTSVQPALSGPGDGFVAKYNFNSNEIEYSTFVGGNYWDDVKDIAVVNNRAIVVGQAQSSSGFPMVNAIETENTPPQLDYGHDAIIAKLNPTGTDYEFTTYLGPEQHPKGTEFLDIEIDASGKLYIVGYSQETHFENYNTGNILQTYFGGGAGHSNLKTYVKQWTGSSWDLVGSSYLNNDLNINSVSPCLGFVGTAPWVSYMDNGQHLVKAYNGSIWEQKGSAIIGGESITVIQDNPYVISIGEVANTIIIKRWNGGDWENTGTGIVYSYGISHAFLASSAYEPFVIWRNGATDQIRSSYLPVEPIPISLGWEDHFSGGAEGTVPAGWEYKLGHIQERAVMTGFGTTQAKLESPTTETVCKIVSPKLTFPDTSGGEASVEQRYLQIRVDSVDVGANWSLQLQQYNNSEYIKLVDGCAEPGEFDIDIIKAIYDDPITGNTLANWSGKDCFIELWVSSLTGESKSIQLDYVRVTDTRLPKVTIPSGTLMDQATPVVLGHFMMGYLRHLQSDDWKYLFSGEPANNKPGGWWDESNNNTFNAYIKNSPIDGLANVIMDGDSGVGKVVSDSKDFNLNIFTKLEVVITHLNGATAGIYVQHWGIGSEKECATGIDKPGTYTFDLPTVTGETGTQNYALIIKVSGNDESSITLDSVRVYSVDPNYCSWDGWSYNGHTPDAIDYTDGEKRDIAAIYYPVHENVGDPDTYTYHEAGPYDQQEDDYLKYRLWASILVLDVDGGSFDLGAYESLVGPEASAMPSGKEHWKVQAMRKHLQLLKDKNDNVGVTKDYVALPVYEDDSHWKYSKGLLDRDTQIVPETMQDLTRWLALFMKSEYAGVQYMIGGRPVIYIFSYEKDYGGARGVGRLSADELNTWRTTYLPANWTQYNPGTTAPNPIIISNLRGTNFPAQLEPGLKYANVLDGFYEWPKILTDYKPTGYPQGYNTFSIEKKWWNTIDGTVRMQVESGAEGFVGAGVWPGFDDWGVNGWGNGRRGISRYEDETEDGAKHYLIDYHFNRIERLGYPVVQVATFNDWWEGSNIEPAKEFDRIYDDSSSGGDGGGGATGESPMLAPMKTTREKVAALHGTAAEPVDLWLPNKLYAVKKNYPNDPIVDAVIAQMEQGEFIQAEALIDPWFESITEGTFTPTATPTMTPTPTLSPTATSTPTTVPTVSYSSYSGGSGMDKIQAVEVDASGYIYVAGYTDSGNLPVTIGAYDETYNGGEDAYLIKYAPDGKSIIYCTYLGGTSHDSIRGIKVDGSGNVYITGSTWSSDFPTTSGAFDTTLGGTRDTFVAKLSADGSTLLYSSYLGGGNMDYGFCIDATDDANVYVGGFTHGGFPTTSGAAQTVFGGYGDGFVTKVNMTTGTIVYSTYVGGDYYESVDALMVKAGEVYVCGGTQSPDFPTTANAIDTINTVGAVNDGGDGYFTKLSTAGDSFVYSTFIGPEQSPAVTAFMDMDMDESGNVYLTGFSSENGFVTTENSIQETYGGGSEDGVVVKLSADFQTVLYSSFLGGNGRERCRSIKIDRNDDIWIVGYTDSSDFPQGSSSSGGLDIFTVLMNEYGQLLWSDRWGGSADEGVSDSFIPVAVSQPLNQLVIGGSTASTDYPVTADALQPGYGGGTQDGFITILNERQYIAPPSPTPTYTATNTLTLTPTPDYGMDLSFSGGTPGEQPGGMYDESDNNTFNAEVKYETTDGYANVSVTAGESWGKVQTYTASIDLSTYHTLEVIVDRIISGTVKIGVFNNDSGWEAHECVEGITRPGTYTVDIPTTTGWSGTKNVGVEVFVEGNNGQAILDLIRIRNGGLHVVSSDVAWEDEMLYSDDVPVSEAGAHPQGWKDSINATLTYDSRDGYMNVAALGGGYPYGTASTGRNITANLDVHRTLEVKIDQVVTGTVKVEVYRNNSYYPLELGISSAGTYRYDLPALMGWSGIVTFGVQLIVEGSDHEAIFDSVRLLNGGTPTPTPTATMTPTPANAWMDDFEGGIAGNQPTGWYDDTDDGNYNSDIYYLATDSYAQVSRTADSTWGKVLTSTINCDVDTFPMVQVNVSAISENTSWKVGIQETEGSWNYWNISSSTENTGTFSFDYAGITGWSGIHNFAVVLIVEGDPGKYIQSDFIRVCRIQATQTPTATVTPTATPENVYWTDFVGTQGEQPDGWLDETQNTMFDCEIMYIATSSIVGVYRTDNMYGKVLSPVITCDVDVYSFVEIKVTNVHMSAGWKIGIQEAEGSYQYWDLHSTQNTTGTYHINFKNITGWTGTHTFQVQINVEGVGGTYAYVDHLRVGGDQTAQGGIVIISDTATPTPTPTVTMTPTKTPTQVVSTATATPTMTPTATATPWLQEKDVMAYPNPARNKVNFAYTIAGEAKVVIDIYKLTGERVANITEHVNGGAGQTLSTAWDAVDVAPGIYFCRIVITDNSGKQVFKINKKVALIH